MNGMVPNDADATLRMMRLLWGVSLTGQLLYLAAISVIWNFFHWEPFEEVARWLFWLSAGGLVAGVPIAFFIRGQIYKRHWVGDAITPRGYFFGMVTVWTTLETVSLCALTAVLLGRTALPAMLPSIICVTLEAACFPTGEPMWGDGFDGVRRMGADEDDER